MSGTAYECEYYIIIRGVYVNIQRKNVNLPVLKN